MSQMSPAPPEDLLVDSSELLPWYSLGFVFWEAYLMLCTENVITCWLMEVAIQHIKVSRLEKGDLGTLLVNSSKELILYH